MNKNHTILSVGSMAFDSVRTPAGKADQVLGGSVNYFSLAASLFTQLKIVAVVGEEDENPAIRRDGFDELLDQRQTR